MVEHLYKWESTESKTTLLEVSIGITITQVCIVIVLTWIKPYLGTGWRYGQSQRCNDINKIINDDDVIHERIEDPQLEPSINHTPQPVTMTALAKYTTAATTYE